MTCKTWPDSNCDPHHYRMSKGDPQKIWAPQLGKVRSLSRFHSTICAEWNEWPLVLANFRKPDRTMPICHACQCATSFRFCTDIFFFSSVKGEWLLQKSTFCLFKRCVCNPHEPNRFALLAEHSLFVNPFCQTTHSQISNHFWRARNSRSIVKQELPPCPALVFAKRHPVTPKHKSQNSSFW